MKWGLILFVTSIATAAPVGFEDPALLARVMKGEIVYTTLVDTKLETKAVVKAYFAGVEPSEYYALTFDYGGYPKIFDEVKHGKLVKADYAAGTYDYQLEVETKVGLITMQDTALGRHTAKPAADPAQESLLHNQLLNFEEYVKSGLQNVRLIPYQGGILVEDTVHFQMKKSDMQTQMAKKKLVEFFSSYTRKIRDVLQD